MESRYQAFLLILASIVLILIIYLNLPATVLKGLVTKNDRWTMIASGDVMLGRTVLTTSLNKKDPTYPFLFVGESLKSADITFVNLESPIVADCPRYSTGLKFCADPEMIDGLVFAGVDVVTLANNHIGNFGTTGIDQTKVYLADKGIDSTLNNLSVKHIKGIDVGFVGLNLVDRKTLTDQEINLIRDSRTKVDYLVVAPHWGYEYQSNASKFQVQMAKSIIESGADLILGSHPHWVQNIEYINQKPVYYSLGNFVFDQMWSEQTKRGLVVKFEFEGVKLVKEEQMPIYMANWAQPVWKF
ncbi:MAG: CapA family protein [Patescibacteria group bacterium]